MDVFHLGLCVYTCAYFKRMLHTVFAYVHRMCRDGLLLKNCMNTHMEQGGMEFSLKFRLICKCRRVKKLISKHVLIKIILDY
jgi:hypothetical protein